MKGAILSHNLMYYFACALCVTIFIRTHISEVRRRRRELDESVVFLQLAIFKMLKIKITEFANK